MQMNGDDDLITNYSKGFGNFYTLWAMIALAENLPAAAALAQRYVAFMEKVQTLADQQDLDAFLREAPAGEYTHHLAYLTNARGASTDLGPRQGRLAALRAGLLLGQ
jgi:hypothetical protein